MAQEGEETNEKEVDSILSGNLSPDVGSSGDDKEKSKTNDKQDSTDDEEEGSESGSSTSSYDDEKSDDVKSPRDDQKNLKNSEIESSKKDSKSGLPTITAEKTTPQHPKQKIKISNTKSIKNKKENVKTAPPTHREFPSTMTIKKKEFRYEGEVDEKKKPNGRGTIFFASGDVLEANFESAIKNGPAFITFGKLSPIERLQTSFVNDRIFTEHNVIIYKNGERYVGDIQLNTAESDKNKKKKKSDQNEENEKYVKTKISKSFPHIYRHGQGEAYLKSGRYFGKFANDRMSGYGVFIYNKKPDPDEIYYGTWANHKREGFGVYVWNDGTVYSGEWKNDDKFGRGVLNFPNGDKIEGIFENESIKNAKFEKCQVNLDGCSVFSKLVFKEKLLSSKNNPESSLQLDFTHFNTFTVFDSMLVRHKWKGFFQYFKEDIEKERMLFEGSELFQWSLSLGMAQRAAQSGIPINNSVTIHPSSPEIDKKVASGLKTKSLSFVKGRSFTGSPAAIPSGDMSLSGLHPSKSTNKMLKSNSCNVDIAVPTSLDDRNVGGHPGMRTPEQKAVQRVKSSDDKTPEHIPSKKKEIPYVLTLTTPSNNPLVEQIRVVKYKILKYFFNERKDFLDKIVNEYFHIFGWTYQTRYDALDEEKKKRARTPKSEKKTNTLAYALDDFFSFVNRLHKTYYVVINNDLIANFFGNYADELHFELSQYTIKKIYKILFKIYTETYKEKDDFFRFKLLSLSQVKMEQFGAKECFIPKDQADPYSEAIKILHNISSCTSPIEKFKILVKVYKEMDQSITKNELSSKAAKLLETKQDKKINIDERGADDIFPVFLYCFIRAQIPNLYSEYMFMTDFCDAIIQRGEEGYRFVNLELAVKYVEGLDVNLKQKDGVLITIAVMETKLERALFAQLFNEEKSPRLLWICNAFIEIGTALNNSGFPSNDELVLKCRELYHLIDETLEPAQMVFQSIGLKLERRSKRENNSSNDIQYLDIPSPSPSIESPISPSSISFSMPNENSSIPRNGSLTTVNFANENNAECDYFVTSDNWLPSYVFFRLANRAEEVLLAA